MARREGKRASQREFEQQNGAAGTCPSDGKSRYLSKRAAKLAIRRLLRKDGHVSAYACGEFWHIGRTPPGVIEGIVSRAELGPTRPRNPYGWREKRKGA